MGPGTELGAYGRSLAFTAVDLKGRCALFRIDVTTGDVSPLAWPIALTYQGPPWSPDGTSLYFQSNDGAIYEWRRPGAVSERSARHRRQRVAELRSHQRVADGRWIASYERPAELLQAVVIRAVEGRESREVFRLSDWELDGIPMPWTPAGDPSSSENFRGHSTCPLAVGSCGCSRWAAARRGDSTSI